MNGNVLLDTNIVIALFAKETAVQRQLAQISHVFLPSIVVGELYFGAYKSSRKEENIQRITEFIARNVILVCDKDTAQQYGKLKSTLKTQGRPIPDNDVWIASLAVQYNLTLITRDEHFHEIPELQIARW